MEIRLTKRWQNRAIGSVLDMKDGEANLLVERLKVAEYVENKTKPEPNSGANGRAGDTSRSKRPVRNHRVRHDA